MGDKRDGKVQPAATEAARRAQAERRAREAEALRSNLLRRKSQTRQRDAISDVPAGPTRRD